MIFVAQKRGHNVGKSTFQATRYKESLAGTLVFSGFYAVRAPAERVLS